MCSPETSVSEGTNIEQGASTGPPSSPPSIAKHSRKRPLVTGGEVKTTSMRGESSAVPDTAAESTAISSRKRLCSSQSPTEFDDVDSTHSMDQGKMDICTNVLGVASAVANGSRTSDSDDSQTLPPPGPSLAAAAMLCPPAIFTSPSGNLYASLPDVQSSLSVSTSTEPPSTPSRATNENTISTRKCIILTNKLKQELDTIESSFGVTTTNAIGIEAGEYIPIPVANVNRLRKVLRRIQRSVNELVDEATNARYEAFQDMLEDWAFLAQREEKSMLKELKALERDRGELSSLVMERDKNVRRKVVERDTRKVSLLAALAVRRGVLGELEEKVVEGN